MQIRITIDDERIDVEQVGSEQAGKQSTGGRTVTPPEQRRAGESTPPSASAEPVEPPEQFQPADTAVGERPGTTAETETGPTGSDVIAAPPQFRDDG